MPGPSLNIGERSKLMFGNKHRISVMRAALRFEIEPPEHFRPLDVQIAIEGTGERILPSELHHAMANLENLGMVERIPEKGRAVYQRIEDPGWMVAEAVVRAVEAWTEQ